MAPTALFGTFLALLLPIVSLAQGTVRMSNNFTVPGARRKAIIGFDSGPLSKEFGRVEILDSTGGHVVTGGLVADGIFSLGVVHIPNAPIGGSGSFILRAWDSRHGATYEKAQLSGFRWGWVTVRLTGLGGGATPPPLLSASGDFKGMITGRLDKGPWTETHVLDPDGTLRMQLAVYYDNAVQLWSSTDLKTWSEAAPIQIVPPNGHSMVVHAEWNLKPPTPVTFYVATIWWDDPP